MSVDYSALPKTHIGIEAALDAWWKEYQPEVCTLPEANSPSVSDDKGNETFYGFETYGECRKYLEELILTEPNRVWTVDTGGDGRDYIYPGYYHGGYIHLVTKKSFDEAERDTLAIVYFQSDEFNS